MKPIVLMVLWCVCIAHAQSHLTLISPETGFSCKIGDTITVNYTADSLYMSGLIGASGILIWLAVNGKSFAQLHPLHDPLGSNSVSVSSAYWGNVPVVVVDSVHIVQNDGSDEWFHTACDSALIKVTDYKDHGITTDVNVIKILPPSATINYACNRGTAHVIVVFHDGILESSKSFASLEFYDLRGRRLGELSGVFKKNISIKGFLSGGAYVVRCGFEDGTQAEMVLIKGM